VKKTPVLLLILGVSLMLNAFSVYAESTDAQNIRNLLTKKFPQSKITRVEKSKVPGIYEVDMPPHILYVSKDAHYVFNGDLIDLESDRNITQEKKAKSRASVINQLGENNMIVYAPKKTKYTVSVFTDIDCPYCRKLHHEMDKYNALGIKVRYLAYPRSGPNSPSFIKAENVWCAKDRKKALDDAFQNKPVAKATCKNPVLEQFITGTRLGVNGTPAIFLENGQILPGYYPADVLIKFLEKSKSF